MVKENIVSKTANRTILHVWPQQRMQQLFTLANECASKDNREKHVYFLCGKIDFRRNGQSSPAYIVRETEATFRIIHKHNEYKEISKDGIDYYNADSFVEIDNKHKLAYPGVTQFQIQVHTRDGTMPVAYLGDGNQMIVE